MRLEPQAYPLLGKTDGNHEKSTEHNRKPVEIINTIVEILRIIENNRQNYAR